MYSSFYTRKTLRVRDNDRHRKMKQKAHIAHPYIGARHCNSLRGYNYFPYGSNGTSLIHSCIVPIRPCTCMDVGNHKNFFFPFSYQIGCNTIEVTFNYINMYPLCKLIEHSNYITQPSIRQLLDYRIRPFPKSQL